jgi:sugar-specific transcriptional regulator TrmB
MSTTLKTLLRELNLSAQETKVYLATLRLGEATVSDIAHAAGLPRTTTASILARLRQDGFVSEHKRKNKCTYWIEDPNILVDKEQARLDVAQELASRLRTQYRTTDKKPTTEIFSSRREIVTLIIKMLHTVPKGQVIKTFDAPRAQNYQAVMTDELFHALSQQKVSRGIRTQALVPTGQREYIRPETLRYAIEVRQLPQGIDFDSSLWLFHHSIVLFSGTYTFAVCVTHPQMATSIAALYDFLWGLSTPLPAQ